LIIFRANTFFGDPQKQLFDLLAVVTSQDFSAKEKSSREKEKIAAQVNEMINKLPDDKPEIQGVKSYFLSSDAYSRIFFNSSIAGLISPCRNNLSARFKKKNFLSAGIISIYTFL